MINKLVVANLRHRPVRTLLSILAIGVEVTMMLTLVGVSRGTLNETARRAENVGADIWVKSPGSSIISMSEATMPQGFVDFFEKQPHITLAVGMVVKNVGGLTSVTGIDLNKFSRMGGGFRFIKGTPFKNPDDVIIDDYYADQNNLSVGSTVNLLGKTWHVSGIFESGKLARIVLPLDVLQNLMGVNGKLSQFLLKVDDPSHVNEIVEQLKSTPGLESYPIWATAEFTSYFANPSNIPLLQPFIYVVIFVAATVGFLIVFLSMYTAVLERTREIGILKSMGASPAYILGILLRETAVLAIIGSLAGIIITFGTRWLMQNVGSASLVQEIVPDWWWKATLISVAGAMLGTFYPGWKAVQQDALDALTYE